MDPRLAQARLYAILDLGYVAAADLETVAGRLIEGGADLLQLRAKGHRPDDIEGFCQRVLPLCRAAGVPFIVNDYPAIAARTGADGVHVGQDGGPLKEIRETVGPRAIVGRSTHSPAQAAAALDEGFDYIGFGPLFPTPTKLGRPGIGIDDVRSVETTVGRHIPVFCIGGIRRDRLAKVTEAGARRVVIVSDLLTAPDVADATRSARAMVGA